MWGAQYADGGFGSGWGKRQGDCCRPLCESHIPQTLSQMGEPVFYSGTRWRAYFIEQWFSNTWSPNQQPQCHLGTCGKCIYTGSTLELPNQDTWGRGPATCVISSPAGNLDAPLLWEPPGDKAQLSQLIKTVGTWGFPNKMSGSSPLAYSEAYSQDVHT